MFGQTNQNGTWGPDSATWRFSALAGAGLVSLGLFGLARPEQAVDAFGMTLRERGVPAWRPKAARDLATGVITLSLLALEEKRPLGTFAAGATLIPALDAVLVAASGSGKPWQVAVHGGTAALTLALGIALLQNEA